MKLYLSGPMTDLPENNYPAFHAAAETLRALGHEVMSPAERQVLFAEPEGPAATPKNADAWRDLMKRGIRTLLECDAMVQLDSWWDSKGARLEFEIARALGMQVYNFAGDPANPVLISNPFARKA